MNKAKLISKFLGFSVLITVSSFTKSVWGYEDPFSPGSFFNPYIIKKRPFSDEYEIRPKYPTFFSSFWKYDRAETSFSYPRHP